MLNWLRRKLWAEMSFEISAIVATKVDLQPGDHLFVTFKSDNIDYHDISNMREQFKKAFPNNMVALFAVGPDDDVKFSTVNPEEKTDGTTNG